MSITIRKGIVYLEKSQRAKTYLQELSLQEVNESEEYFSSEVLFHQFASTNQEVKAIVEFPLSGKVQTISLDNFQFEPFESEKRNYEKKMVRIRANKI